jgi:hypothetical protein
MRQEILMPSHWHQDNYKITRRTIFFLLDVAAAIWGMGMFNQYLKGKTFILHTDHKA